MKRSPTDWLCICGKRHTGLPLDPEIWGEATAMAHRPVSIYEFLAIRAATQGGQKRSRDWPISGRGGVE